MYTVINNLDMTAYVNTDIDLETAMTDPMAKTTFTLDDPDSQIWITSQMPVVIIDETGAPNPTHNLLIGGDLHLDGSQWFGENIVGGGCANIGINSSTGIATVTANGNTGATIDGQNVPMTEYDVNYPNGNARTVIITPGQTYMFSITMSVTTPLTNAEALIQLLYLDAGFNTLATFSATALTGTALLMHVAGIAPAGAYYAQVQFGMASTGGATSGVITYQELQLEPVFFTQQTYPTPFCAPGQTDCTQLPDGTTVRQSRLFYGVISDLERDYANEPDRVYTLTVQSGVAYLDRTLVSVTYTNQYDSQIIADLLTNSAYGLAGVFNTVSVVQGVQIVQVSYDLSTVRDIINALTDESGFVVNVDAYLNFTYAPPVYNPAPFGLSDQPDYVNTFPFHDFKAKDDGTQIKNRVTIDGGKYIAGPITDTFTGDGHTKTFNLSQQPNTVYSITLNGTAQKYGWDTLITLGSGGYVVSVSQSAQHITFQTAPVSGAAIAVNYDFQSPIRIKELDPNSASAHNGWIFDSVIHDTSLVTVQAAQQRAIAETQEFGYSRMIYTLTSQMQPLVAGMLVPIWHRGEGLSGQAFLVQSVKQHEMDSEGGGVYEWEATIGAYNPEISQILTHLHKAADASQTVATIPITSFGLTASDQIAYSDSLTGTPGAVHVTYGTYEQTILADGPTAYYRFDESSGTTANDSSGNGYSGTYAGSGVIYDQPGALIGDADTAVLLDGAAGEMTCPVGVNTAGWSAFAIEVWVKLTTIPSSKAVIADNDTGISNKGFALYFAASAASLNLSIGNGSSHATATYTFAFSAGIWYHLLGTWDGTTITLYVNGASVATAAKSGSMGTPGYNLVFGYNIVSGGGYLPATLDEAAIYNAVVSAARVLAHYNKGLAATPPRYGFAQWS